MRRADFAPMAASTLLLAADRFYGMNILSDHFKPVPDDYIVRSTNGRDVVVNCVCGGETELRFGQLLTCDCGRVLWNGTTVYAAPPAPPMPDHTCRPDFLTLPSGKTCVTDYCAECKADLA